MKFVFNRLYERQILTLPSKKVVMVLSHRNMNIDIVKAEDLTLLCIEKISTILSVQIIMNNICMSYISTKYILMSSDLRLR